MRFRITKLFYMIALIGSAIGAFGPWGVGLAIIILLLWWGFYSIRSRSAIAVVGLSLLGGVWLVSFFVLLPWPKVHSTSRRMTKGECAGNLRYLAEAIRVYHDSYGRYPPPYLTDKDGKPMHSWRVLILPFIEERKLYEQYDFDEPWDGPNNSLLAAQMPSVYNCPSWSGRKSQGLTSYVAIVGSNTMWPDAGRRKQSDITDEAATTLMLIEAPDTAIHWMEPRDWSVEDVLAKYSSNKEPWRSCSHWRDYYFSFYRGWNAVFADESTGFLNAPVPRQKILGLVTIDGGEELPPDVKTFARRPKWGRIVSMSLFPLFAIFPLVWLPGHLKRLPRTARSPVSPTN